MSDLDDYIDEYEWCADEGTYTPTNAERFMLLDAILGWEDRKDQLSDNTTLIEKLEGMKGARGYIPAHNGKTGYQTHRMVCHDSYNQALQDAIDLIKEEMNVTNRP